MAHILVVDYSRSGNTRKVAQAIASACDADMEQIQDIKPRSGLRGWLRSAREAMRRMPAEIGPARRDPRNYDLVVLGSPVWAGHVSSPMRRYLRDRAGEMTRIALFVTEGGSGGSKAMDEMARLAKCSPVASLELRQKDLDGQLHSKISGFVDQVRKAAEVGAPSVS